MNTLVVGGTGFIGEAFANTLYDFNDRDNVFFSLRTRSVIRVCYPNAVDSSGLLERLQFFGDNS
jgi:nucleoside-diphosphate-sugar epimerase